MGKKGVAVKKIVAVMCAALVTVGLSGCFQNPIEAAIEQAAEEGVERALEDSGVDVDLGLDGDVSLPDGWPSNLPVPEGNIISASTVDGAMAVIIEVGSPETGLAGIDAIAAAGYTVTFEQDIEGMRTVAFSSADYEVVYGVLTDGEATTVTITAIPATN